MSIIVFMLVVAATALLAASFAYWFSRRHFEGELSYQQRVYGTELARLKRQVNRADARVRSATQEAERLRRRIR